MKTFLFQTTESMRMAWEQICGHKFRSLLTALGVIMGIVAVSLIGAAMQGIDRGFDESLSMLGSDTFFIQKYPWFGEEDTDWRTLRRRQDIYPRYTKAINKAIKSNSESVLQVAVPVVQQGKRVQSLWKTIDWSWIIGTTTQFTELGQIDLKVGRFFTAPEDAIAKPVVILGHEVADKLFPNISPMGEELRIADHRFLVIGVLKQQDSMFDVSSLNEQIFMPLAAMRQLYRHNYWSHIRIKMKHDESKDVARNEIINILRPLRSLGPGEKNDFELNFTDLIEEKVSPAKNGIAFAGLFITGLSLFVGAIGIMNITFVSVKERTREIGTRRALGARQSAILTQFLVEAMAISLLGGTIGLSISYALTLFVEHTFPDFPILFSPELVGIGAIVSLITGVFSGVAPAYSASRLDPVVALRHE